MKKLLRLGLFFLVINLLGCDESFQFAEELNQSPTIKITGIAEGVGLIKQKIKYISGKDNIKFFRVTFNDPNENLLGFLLINKGKTLDNGLKIFRGEKLLKYNTLNTFDKRIKNNDFVENIGFSFSFASNKEILLRAKDSFGKEFDVLFELEIVNNVAPEAILEIIPPTDLSHIYTLDGSLSKDLDEDLGGKIIGYEFGFLEKTITMKSSEIKVPFYDAGTHEVSLVVIDNELARSAKVTKRIVVEDEGTD